MTTSTHTRALALASVGLVLATAACSSAGTSTTPSAGAASSATSRMSTLPSASVGLLTATGKNTDLTLNASTVTALKNAGVQVAPVAPATTTSSGATSFPITGGTLARSDLKGRLEHSGGVTFSHSGRSLTATSFVLSTTTGLLTAEVDGKRVPLLDVDVSRLTRTTSGSAFVASGMTSTLNRAAAVLLDGKLLVTAFKQGLPVGTLTANVTTSPASPSSTSSGEPGTSSPAGGSPSSSSG